MEIQITAVEGGVTAPKGFFASGIHCGLRKNKSKKDLALIYSPESCAAAAIFTTNKVFAAPVGVSRAHLAGGKARAIICNSGNANTCNADGYEKANATCRTLAEKLGIAEEEIIVASTGVIGIPLAVEPILGGIPELAASLSDGPEGSEAAAVAIMTTDTKKKEYAVRYDYEGKTVTIGGICKGSGMIEPNMATMLGFITTDAAISAPLLGKALKAAADTTFNMVSVDGDTSTNDTLAIMASGKSGSAEITGEGGAYGAFCEALGALCLMMCKAIAADGEGATKLIECTVAGHADFAGARRLAKSVIKSPLVKTAMFGADANWGRILCAMGYSGAEFDPDRVDVSFRSKAGEAAVCKNGHGVPFDEDAAKDILSKNYVYIDINTNLGNESATAWGCDLSYEYVRINGDYRS